MKPEIRTLPDQEIYTVRKTGTIGRNFNRAADLAFSALTRYTRQQGLMDAVVCCLGICPDDPEEVPAEHCRYDAGYIFKEGIHPKPTGEVKVQVLPGGRWAVFIHRGPYETLWQTWRAIYRDWLPESGEQLREAAPYEVYLTDKGTTNPDALIAEIFIAIQ